MKKRIFVLLLTLCMLLSVGVACKTGNDDNKKDPGYDVPVIDYGGKDFRIYAKSNMISFEVFGDVESTDICEQALYNRNATVEYDYNIYIQPVDAPAGMTLQVAQIVEDVLSDASNYELAMTYAFDTTPLIVNGYVYNWKNFKYTHLDASWWMNDINDGFTIFDDIYATVGYMNTSTISYTFGMYYNRTKGEMWEAGLTDKILQTVRDGDWTYDYFHNLVKDVYEDVDDEVGVRSANDFYGFQAEANVNVDAYHFAWELPTITNDPDKGLSIDNYYNDKLVEAADKITELYFESNGSYIFATNDNPGNTSAPGVNFKAGKALFTTTWLDRSFKLFREDMEDDYVIFPYPKFDDAQKDYHTGIMTDYNVLVVPTTVQDTEYVSLIVEALNKESEESMYEVYLVTALQEKYTGDDETIEMLEYLLDGRVVDIAYLLSGEVNISFLLRIAIKDKSNDITQPWNKNKDAYQQKIDNIMAKYKQWSDYGKA